MSTQNEEMEERQVWLAVMGVWGVFIKEKGTFFGGVKYACIPCHIGGRNWECEHHKEELFPAKGPGRPRKGSPHVQSKKCWRGQCDICGPGAARNSAALRAQAKLGINTGSVGSAPPMLPTGATSSSLPMYYSGPGQDGQSLFMPPQGFGPGPGVDMGLNPYYPTGLNQPHQLENLQLPPHMPAQMQNQGTQHGPAFDYSFQQHVGYPPIPQNGVSKKEYVPTGKPRSLPKGNGVKKATKAKPAAAAVSTRTGGRGRGGPTGPGLPPGSGLIGSGTPSTGYEGHGYGFPEVFHTMPSKPYYGGPVISLPPLTDLPPLMTPSASGQSSNSDFMGPGTPAASYGVLYNGLPNAFATMPDPMTPFGGGQQPGSGPGAFGISASGSQAQDMENPGEFMSRVCNGDPTNCMCAAYVAFNLDSMSGALYSQPKRQ
ncbi:Uu.00g125310.m01.CDS01 [Anthostomella pinea]|uniref:Uu.00g125310.m01.CDS01 n=1 Tax=Anthostomella pinea TaxID=933095 RepID=A0AAI8VCG2_9PEZI|nr:Uu.00g125310.m01.CDS01 [Anthostomella pinea]